MAAIFGGGIILLSLGLATVTVVLPTLLGREDPLGFDHRQRLAPQQAGEIERTHASDADDAVAFRLRQPVGGGAPVGLGLRRARPAGHELDGLRRHGQRIGHPLERVAGRGLAVGQKERPADAVAAHLLRQRVLEHAVGEVDPGHVGDERHLQGSRREEPRHPAPCPAGRGLRSAASRCGGGRRRAGPPRDRKRAAMAARGALSPRSRRAPRSPACRARAGPWR